jgi:DNA replication and repair protein RecF
MHLGWLELRDFRSYPHLEFRPDPGINVLVGHNGAGKTNILEAISYLSVLRSFRSAPDAALISAGADEGIIRGGFEHPAGETTVEVALPAAGRRRILLNGKRPVRHRDVASQVPVVAFLPDDLDVIKRGPGLRRDYVDDLGAQLTPAVGGDQTEFEKAVRQRNTLLRTEGRMADRLTLEVWDERVAETGSRVIVNRLRLLDRLAPAVESAYATVAGGRGEVSWEYRSSWVGSVDTAAIRDAETYAAALTRALGERRERDLDQRTTTTGPHRDEPAFLLRGRDTRTQASQGEQRSVALSLRIAAYRLLDERHGRPPILLLDDVFSELDPNRSAAVVDLLPRGQVLVTTARDDEVPVTGRRWRVREGTIS